MQRNMILQKTKVAIDKMKLNERAAHDKSKQQELEIADLRAQAEAQSIQLNAEQKSVEILRSEKGQLQTDLHSTRQLLGSTQETSDSQATKIVEYTQMISSLKLRLQEAEAEAKKEFESVTTQLQEEKIKTARLEGTNSSLGETEESSKRQLHEQRQVAQQTQEKNVVLAQERARLDARSEGLQRQVDDFRSQTNRLTAERDQAREDGRTKTNDLERTRQELSALKEKSETQEREARTNMDAATLKLSDTTQLNAEAAAKKLSLAEMSRQESETEWKSKHASWEASAQRFTVQVQGLEQNLAETSRNYSESVTKGAEQTEAIAALRMRLGRHEDAARANSDEQQLRFDMQKKEDARMHEVQMQSLKAAKKQLKQTLQSTEVKPCNNNTENRMGRIGVFSLYV